MKTYTIDGIAIDSLGDVEMTGYYVPPSPPIENNDESQAGKDGGWDFGIQYGPKIIEVDHYINAQDKVTRKATERRLAGFLNPRIGTRQIIFQDDPDFCYFGRLSNQFDLGTHVASYSDFTLNFTCYDPFTYSVQEYSPTITTSGTIDHLGEHVAQPILTVDHKGGTATIVNTTPSGDKQTIEFTAETPQGTYIIDCKAKTVIRGTGSGDKYMKDPIQWFEMPKGINTITHGVNINKVTVRYRHTWL